MRQPIDMKSMMQMESMSSEVYNNHSRPGKRLHKQLEALQRSMRTFTRTLSLPSRMDQFFVPLGIKS